MSIIFFNLLFALMAYGSHWYAPEHFRRNSSMPSRGETGTLPLRKRPLPPGSPLCGVVLLPGGPVEEGGCVHSLYSDRIGSRHEAEQLDWKSKHANQQFNVQRNKEYEKNIV